MAPRGGHLALRQIWSKLNHAALRRDRGCPQRSPREASTSHTPTGILDPSQKTWVGREVSGCSLLLIPASHPDQAIPPFPGPGLCWPFPGQVLAGSRAYRQGTHSPMHPLLKMHSPLPQIASPQLRRSFNLNYLEFIWPARIIGPLLCARHWVQRLGTSMDVSGLLLPLPVYSPG